MLAAGQLPTRDSTDDTCKRPIPADGAGAFDDHPGDRAGRPTPAWVGYRRRMRVYPTTVIDVCPAVMSSTAMLVMPPGGRAPDAGHLLLLHRQRRCGLRPSRVCPRRSAGTLSGLAAAIEPVGFRGGAARVAGSPVGNGAAMGDARLPPKRSGFCATTPGATCTACWPQRASRCLPGPVVSWPTSLARCCSRWPRGWPRRTWRVRWRAGRSPPASRQATAQICVPSAHLIPRTDPPAITAHNQPGQHGEKQTGPLDARQRPGSAADMGNPHILGGPGEGKPTTGVQGNPNTPRMRVPGKAVRRAYWASYACTRPGIA